MKHKYYINLTTGIEALNDIPLINTEIGFTRIQSTHCERLLLEDILISLSSDLLFHLALGTTCIIIDYGARTHSSKATRTGLEWVRFSLNKLWFDNDYYPMINQKDVSLLFNQKFKALSKQTKNRIKFYRKFLRTNRINLIGLSKLTLNDSKELFYLNLIKENMK